MINDKDNHFITSVLYSGRGPRFSSFITLYCINFVNIDLNVFISLIRSSKGYEFQIKYDETNLLLLLLLLDVNLIIIIVFQNILIIHIV